MPACAETNRAMQELTGVKSNSSEQNKDMSKARQKRAEKDALVILTTIADRDPFSADLDLRNIMMGMNAHNAVTVDRARAIGEKILSSMTGKSATDYTFKRRSQAVTLATKSSVSIESDTVQVDPQLLFQRLIVACNRSDDLQGLFRYELCCYIYPVVLFDSSLTLRQPQMIRCNCSSDCASARCTCGKHGLECSPACGQGRGTACTNSPIQIDQDDSQDE